MTFDMITRLYLSVDKLDTEADGETAAGPGAQITRFYALVKPLLSGLIEYTVDTDSRVLLPASTAHHLMRLFRIVLRCNPREVLHMASLAAIASRRTNYNFDSLPIKDIVDLVEVILADYRHEVRDEQSLADLVALLDVFVDAGWPEALNLVWRLDEVYR